MSRLAEFRRLEQQLAAQLAELEQLKNDDALKDEIKFEEQLRALLAEYGFSLRDVVNILDPQTGQRQALSPTEAKGIRKPREVKTYKNPHNGETVQTKGGNHAVLKAWKTQYGVDAVQSWLQ